MSDDVTIADAIKQLRAQLIEAIREGEGKSVRFLPKSVEVELTMVLKSQVDGGGGIKAWFVDVSVKGSTGNEATHKVKLTLDVVGPGGKPTEISDYEP